MRYFPVASILLVAACSSPEEEAGEPAPVPEGEAIACALGEASEFTEDCTLERREGEVVIHHPDGGFRRFSLDPAGGGLVAADGADASNQRIDGDWLVLTLGANRYRIPFRPVDDEADGSATGESAADDDG